MRRFLGKVTDLPYAVLASATVAVIAAPGEASAQETISNLSTEWRSHIGELGNLVVAGGFLAGIALIAAGLMKLKQAADTQGQQVKYSEGMWRLGVGAALVAVPALTDVGTASLGLGSPETSLTPGFSPN